MSILQCSLALVDIVSYSRDVIFVEMFSDEDILWCCLEFVNTLDDTIMEF